MKAFFFLIEDKCSFFHTRRGKERYIPIPRELLWCLSTRVVLRRWEVGNWYDDIKMICDQRFIRDDYTQGKLFEDCYLSDLGNLYGLMKLVLDRLHEGI